MVVPSFHCLRRAETALYPWVRHMLIAALIFVMSIAVIIQFGALSWHAGLIRVAAESVPSAHAIAAAKPLISEDFSNITAYGKLCPDFADGSYLQLRAVRLYYRGLQLLKDLGQMNWAAREMGLCTRYAAVMLSQRLERNQAMMASVRSF
jgi:hypothetical protein